MTSMLDSMRDGAWLDEQVFPALQWSVEGILPRRIRAACAAPPKAGNPG